MLGGSLRDEAARRVTRVARETYEKTGRSQDREEMALILRAGSGTGYGKASLVQRLERWRREYAEIERSEMGIYESDVEEFDRFISDREDVLQAGGLHVIGCVRHEARRIDNQLRGRAARQGDPGSSQFFLSLEDELMRLFGGSQVGNIMQRLNIDDAMPIAHNIVDRTIEQAQTRVEGANFDTRKHLLEYDDVLNQQREVFYGQRNRVFEKDDLSDDIAEMLHFEIARHVEAALDDPEGPWRLLAWLEEMQPTIDLDADEPYPSFMLRLLIDQLLTHRDPIGLQDALLTVARQALEEQQEHLLIAIDNQLTRAVERLEDQVAQRVDMADMAVEAAFLEAEETGSEVNLNELINAVEASSGMRIQMSEDVLDHIRADPYKFRDNIPQLIESGLSLRIWAGLIQAVERRVGESLELQSQMTTPIDWFAAGDRLREAFSRAWEERTNQLLTEIERDLENALGRADQVDEGLINRLLVQMSYGRKAYFDRKTHQRQSVVVARLSYVYSAARLLEGEDQTSLVERVLSHLEGARTALQVGLGRAEMARHAGSRLDQLDQRNRDTLRAAIGEEQFTQIDTESPINQMPDGIQDQIQRILGEGVLSRIYRELILSVGDRLWVEYLTRMEALRTSIGLEAYGQRDPLVQYKSRAFDMFGQLLADVRAGVISRLFSMRASGRPSTAQVSAPQRPREKMPMEAKETTVKKKRKRKRKRRR